MTVKLTDFGIARAVEQTRITQVGSVVGTAAYLAPEQVRGEEATPATDVYALGVVLYQFLTGRLPYEGSSLAELAVRQQNERRCRRAPTTTRSRRRSAPPCCGRWRATRARRYASADELAGGLQLGLQGEDVTLPLARRTPRDQRARRRDRDPPPRPHRADRVPPAPSPTRRPRRAPPPAPAGRPRGRRRPHAEALRLLPLRPLRPGRWSRWS